MDRANIIGRLKLYNAGKALCSPTRGTEMLHRLEFESEDPESENIIQDKSHSRMLA